ncbi:MAG: proline dehydrogenase family protein, partial [Fidelibacterota bacterium]
EHMNFINEIAVRILPAMPEKLVGYFSKRYIAGDSLEDAIKVVKDLNKKGICATIDILGELVNDREDAVQAMKDNMEILEAIEADKLNSNLSLKPTHLGLKIDRDFCLSNIKKVVEKAEKMGNFVRLDMEDSTCTSDTIYIYKELRKNSESIGIAIQAYLRRSYFDVKSLEPYHPNIRLCKGIYREPREIAYKDRDVINKNYALLLEKLLKNGCYVGIATHDESLIWEAYRLIDELNLDSQKYEFQMLLGVDPQLRDIIVNDGNRLRVYVPFGKDWYPYSLRRLKENPRIAGYIIRNIFTD